MVTLLCMAVWTEAKIIVLYQESLSSAHSLVRGIEKCYYAIYQHSHEYHIPRFCGDLGMVFRDVVSARLRYGGQPSSCFQKL